jgi:hypothetical protein
MTFELPVGVVLHVLIVIVAGKSVDFVCPTSRELFLTLEQELTRLRSHQRCPQANVEQWGEYSPIGSARRIRLNYGRLSTSRYIKLNDTIDTIRHWKSSR